MNTLFDKILYLKECYYDINDENNYCIDSFVQWVLFMWEILFGPSLSKRTVDGPSGWQEVVPSKLAVDSSGVLEISVISCSCLCLWWKGCNEKRRCVFLPPLLLLIWGLSFRIVLFRSTWSWVYTRRNSD